jgi:hypothetical protein
VVPPRTVEQLRADAWQAFTDALTAGRTVTPKSLAKAARLTDGGAHRFLTEWRAEGRAAPVPLVPPPGPHNAPWTVPAALPAGTVPAHPSTPAPSERSTDTVTRTRPKPSPTPPAEPEPLTPEQMRSALRAAALSYAARGWHVFPLRPGDKRPAFPDHPEDACTGADPRCRQAGRHVTWEERSTTDPDRIGRAWLYQPYGIGIACGPSRLLVVDQDVPKSGQAPPQAWQRPGVVDGADVFAHLCHDHAGTDFPDTPTVLTPSGGRHLYYAHPDGVRLGNTAGTLGWLVDTRGWGGYVVAPPTVIGGNAYRMVVHASVAPLPGWIADALRPSPRPAQRPVSVALTGSGGGSRRDAYLRSAVSGQLDLVAQAVEGERNRALYRSAIALGQLAAGGELDPGQVGEWLSVAAVGVGLDDAEASRTIRSGMRAGAKRPRTLATPGTATGRAA